MNEDIPRRDVKIATEVGGQRIAVNSGLDSIVKLSPHSIIRCEGILKVGLETDKGECAYPILGERTFFNSEGRLSSDSASPIGLYVEAISDFNVYMVFLVPANYEVSEAGEQQEHSQRGGIAA